jgi:hypothetical protein
MLNSKPEENPFSVPVPLRVGVFYVCRLEPMKTLAQMMYRFAARAIGNSLTRFSSTRAVYLMGGSAHRIIPALSDLDFLLFTEINPDVILKLRRVFLLHKKRYWIPGEIIPLDEKALKFLETSGCSLSIHIFGRTKKIAGDTINITPTIPPDPASLFMLLIRFLVKATSSLSGGLRNASLYNIFDCQRHLSKIIALNSGTKVTSYLSEKDPTSLVQLFCEAYLLLDKRAKNLIREIFPNGVPFEIASYLGDPTNMPEQRIFRAESTKDVISDLFQQTLNTQARTTSFPLCLSESTAICRLIGLTLESWSQVLSRLSSLPAEITIPILTVVARERAMRRYFQLPGDIMLNSQEAIRSKLNQFCRLGCYLATQGYFLERESLAECAEPILPNTTRTLRRTHQGSSQLSIQDMVENTILVRNELEKFIFNL